MPTPNMTAPIIAGFAGTTASCRSSARSASRTGSGFGSTRCVVEHANAWLLANKRLDRRNDRLAMIIDTRLTAISHFLIANRIVGY
jgi:hypothetical protein